MVDQPAESPRPPQPPITLSWQDVRSAYVSTCQAINMGWSLKERQLVQMLLLGAETLVVGRDVLGQVNGVPVVMENIRGPGLKHGEMTKMVEALLSHVQLPEAQAKALNYHPSLAWDCMSALCQIYPALSSSSPELRYELEPVYSQLVLPLLRHVLQGGNQGFAPTTTIIQSLVSEFDEHEMDLIQSMPYTALQDLISPHLTPQAHLPLLHRFHNLSYLLQPLSLTCLLHQLETTTGTSLPSLHSTLTSLPCQDPDQPFLLYLDMIYYALTYSAQDHLEQFRSLHHRYVQLGLSSTTTTSTSTTTTTPSRNSTIMSSLFLLGSQIFTYLTLADAADVIAVLEDVWARAQHHSGLTYARPMVLQYLSHCWTGHEACQGPAPALRSLFHLLALGGCHELDQLRDVHEVIRRPTETHKARRQEMLERVGQQDSLELDSSITITTTTDPSSTTLHHLLHYAVLARDRDCSSLLLGEGLESLIAFTRCFPSCPLDAIFTMGCNLIQMQSTPEEIKYFYDVILPSTILVCVPWHHSSGTSGGGGFDVNTRIVAMWEVLTTKGAKPAQFYASVWPVLIKSLKSLTGFEDGARGQALSQLLPAIEGYTWQTRDEQGYSVVTDALQVAFRLSSCDPSPTIQIDHIRLLLSKILSKDLVSQPFVQQQGLLTGMEVAGLMVANQQLRTKLASPTTNHREGVLWSVLRSTGAILMAPAYLTVAAARSIMPRPCSSITRSDGETQGGKTTSTTTPASPPWK